MQRLVILKALKDTFHCHYVFVLITQVADTFNDSCYAERLSHCQRCAGC